MSDRSEIKLIVGLGNPGDEYASTRHNVGFMIVDELLKRLPQDFDQKNAYGSIFYQGRFKGKSLFLQKPQTYMNLSGTAVKRLCNVEKISPEEILLIYDDKDLPLGRMRLRERGSSGGHRGVESLIEELQSNAFKRLRVGIGSDAQTEVSDYVLSGFSDEELPRWQQIRLQAVNAALMCLSGGMVNAMNRFNNLDLSAAQNNNPPE